MRRLVRALARRAGTPAAGAVIELLRASGRRGGLAVVYHGLATRSGDPARELVPPHGLDLVESQLRFLARHFRIVDAADLPDSVAARSRGEPFPAAVTFDDDLESHVRLALPLLRRHGIRATFFLTGATLKAPYSFWWQTLERDPAALGRAAAVTGLAEASLRELAARIEQLDPATVRALEEQIGTAPAADAGLRAGDVRALCDVGMTIGFHTRRHHALPLLPDEELATALAEGRNELQEAVRSPLTLIAYPHGTADRRVAEAARESGFSIGYTGRPRAVRPGDHPLLLGRLEPSHASVGQFAVQLARALLGAGLPSRASRQAETSD
jgi:peptidoglycan/xylan/chitin deacetylase (PgdA/CDA1 family)